MGNKVYKLEAALDLIHSGDTVATSGFGLCSHAEEISVGLEERFLQTGSPNHLTLYYGSGMSDWHGHGVDHFAHEGFLDCAVAGHYGAAVNLGQLIFENKVKAYNLPQGILQKMFRSRVEGLPGAISQVGLHTYVDPRLEGGRMNAVTDRDLVEVINIKEEEYLFYPAPKIDVGIIRGTCGDTEGNISIEDEAVPTDIRLIAMAAKASGGKVIAQVKHIVPAGTLMPNKIHVPGIFVDAVVQTSDPVSYHKQSSDCYYDKALSGDIIVPAEQNAPLPLDAKKVIARRCALELTPNAVVNLGIGTPEYVGAVAEEEGCGRQITLTLESGIFGGQACKGLGFGAARNFSGVLEQSPQFDFYDGGGLDIAFLGLAQTNRFGDVNVSKFSGKVTGCGGFINISQRTPKLIYCGTFTAGGLRETFQEGRLHILQEGRNLKFVDHLEQVTYSGSFGAKCGQQVLFVTERAVFELTRDGLMLTEIAPGVELERDILKLMEFAPLISPDLKIMDESLFKEELIGLKERFPSGDQKLEEEGSAT